MSKFRSNRTISLALGGKQNVAELRSLSPGIVNVLLSTESLGTSVETDLFNASLEVVCLKAGEPSAEEHLSARSSNLSRPTELKLSRLWTIFLGSYAMIRGGLMEKNVQLCRLSKYYLSIPWLTCVPFTSPPRYSSSLSSSPTQDQP